MQALGLQLMPLFGCFGDYKPHSKVPATMYTVCRWQALSRSLERVVAVHGDEGDDQHGLKVHEIHDMQPGMPCKPAGDALASTLPLQPLDTAQQGQSGTLSNPPGEPQNSSEDLQIAVHQQPVRVVQEGQSTHNDVVCSQLSPRLGQTDLLSTQTRQQSLAANQYAICSLTSRSEEGEPASQAQLRQPSQPALLAKPATDAQAAICYSNAEAPSAETFRGDMGCLCPAGQQDVNDAATHREPQQSGENGIAAVNQTQQGMLLPRTLSIAGTAEQPAASSQHDVLQYQQAVGMQNRVKAMLRKSKPPNTQSEHGQEDDAELEAGAQTLTQVEVIVAQTADQEAPQASSHRKLQTVP